MADEDQAPAVEAAAPKGPWTVALLDKDGALRGFKQVTDELLWARADGQYPWPNNAPDLAVGRYRLVRDPATGKEQFAPIMHPKDRGEENVKEEIAIVPVLARLVRAQIAGGDPIDLDQLDKDKAALFAYLKTFDAQG